jgi:hypothetical protein
MFAVTDTKVTSIVIVSLAVAGEAESMLNQHRLCSLPPTLELG